MCILECTFNNHICIYILLQCTHFGGDVHLEKYICILVVSSSLRENPIVICVFQRPPYYSSFNLIIIFLVIFIKDLHRALISYTMKMSFIVCTSIQRNGEVLKHKHDRCQSYNSIKIIAFI